jgi:hypothetical protein
LKVEPASAPGVIVLTLSHVSKTNHNKHSDGGGEQGDLAHVTASALTRQKQATLIRSVGV